MVKEVRPITFIRDLRDERNRIFQKELERSMKDHPANTEAGVDPEPPPEDSDDMAAVSDPPQRRGRTARN